MTLGRSLASSRADRNRVPARLTAEQDNHFSNEFIYIDQLVAADAPFLNSKLILLMMSAARVTSLTILDAASRCLCHVGLIATKPSQAGLGVCYCCGNRLLDLVRKRSGQLSHRGHPIDMREIRLGLTQSFALFTRQLAFNGNAGEVGGHFQGAGLSRARTARFAVIHGKRAQRLARMRKYGSGPAGAEPIGLGHASVRLPERILRECR